MRFIRGEREGWAYAFAISKEPGYKALIVLEFGSRQWIWQFGRGDGYDW